MELAKVVEKTERREFWKEQGIIFIVLGPILSIILFIYKFGRKIRFLRILGKSLEPVLLRMQSGT